MLNEKKIWSWILSCKQQFMLLRWNQSGSCLTHDPQRKDKICAGSYLVQRTVWAVFSSEREEAKHHKWSNYLRMRSLFGSIIVWLYGPQRLSQAAQLAVLSHLCVRLVMQRHFSEFGWRALCPAVGSVIRPFIEQPSVRFILSVTADTHVGVKNGFVACWLCLNTLSSLLVPKWSLWIWCFWNKWHFMFLPFC